MNARMGCYRKRDKTLGIIIEKLWKAIEQQIVKRRPNRSGRSSIKFSISQFEVAELNS